MIVMEDDRFNSKGGADLMKLRQSFHGIISLVQLEVCEFDKDRLYAFHFSKRGCLSDSHF
jgi:hypothetical protein